MIAKKSLFALAKALEGIPVLGALAGTPAARAGIRYGDVLISVNGKRTKTVADYVEAKALRSDGMDVVIFRTGEEQLSHLKYDSPPTNVDPLQLISELIALRIVSPDDDRGGGSEA